MICLMSNFRLLAVNLQLSAGHGWEVLKVQQTNSSQQVIEGEQLDQGISPHHSIQCRLVRTEFMQQMLVIKQTQPIMIRTKFWIGKENFYVIYNIIRTAFNKFNGITSSGRPKLNSVCRATSSRAGMRQTPPCFPCLKLNNKLLLYRYNPKTAPPIRIYTRCSSLTHAQQ